MKDIKPAILLFIMCTIICGGIYPALVTGIAHALFPGQAKGFIIDKNGKVNLARLLHFVAVVRKTGSSPTSP